MGLPFWGSRFRSGICVCVALKTASATLKATVVNTSGLVDSCQQTHLGKLSGGEGMLVCLQFLYIGELLTIAGEEELSLIANLAVLDNFSLRKAFQREG